MARRASSWWWWLWVYTGCDVIFMYVVLITPSAAPHRRAPPVCHCPPLPNIFCKRPYTIRIMDYGLLYREYTIGEPIIFHRTNSSMSWVCRRSIRRIRFCIYLATPEHPPPPALAILVPCGLWKRVIKTQDINKISVSMKITIFRVVAPCSLVEVYRRFRGASLPPSSGRWVSRARLTHRPDDGSSNWWLRPSQCSL
jgi:hypothetical protein